MTVLTNWTILNKHITGEPSPIWHFPTRLAFGLFLKCFNAKSSNHLPIDMSFDNGWKKQHSWVLNPWSNNKETCLHKSKMEIFISTILYSGKICKRQHKTYHTLSPKDQKDTYLADSLTSAKGVTQPRGTYNKN